MFYEKIMKGENHEALKTPFREAYNKLEKELLENITDKAQNKYPEIPT
jgi:hypothetical protein